MLRRREETVRELKVIDLLAPGLIVAACCVGAGAMVQSRFDDAAAAKLAKEAATDREHTRMIFEEREKHLIALIDSERKDNARNAQNGHRHMASFTANAARVRNELEAMLAGSRAANDACTARIASISEDVGELDELLSQGAGLLEAGQGEIGRLQEENRSLAAVVAGWQQRYRDEHPESVTVTGQRAAR
jgi:hypothetical protein